MAFFGNEAAIPGAATSISSLLSITDPAKKHYRRMVLKIVGANDAFWGPSGVTTGVNRAGILRVADPAVVLDGDANVINTDEIYIVGTAAGGNIVHITLIS